MNVGEYLTTAKGTAEPWFASEVFSRFRAMKSRVRSYGLYAAAAPTLKQVVPPLLVEVELTTCNGEVELRVEGAVMLILMSGLLPENWKVAFHPTQKESFL